MSEFFKRLLIATIALSALALLPGCAGTMTSKTTQTVTTTDAKGLPVTVVTDTEVKKPKDIAFQEASADKHAACVPAAVVTGQTVSFGLHSINPMELKSGGAQSDYMDAMIVNQLATSNNILAQALSANPEVACHEAVAKESVAYYAMEAKRSSNRWGFGKFLAGFAGAYLIADSIVDGMATAGAVGDTNIGEVNVSGNASGGAGGEAAGGQADMAQNVNIGNGTLNSAADGGLNAFGEKPILGDGNVFEDNDSPNTSVF